MSIKKTINWSLVAICMAVIFYLSSQPANVSSQASRQVTEVIVETVQKVKPDMTEVDIRDLNSFVRKNAHFIIYLLLGFLTINALYEYNTELKKKVILAFAICVLYAISDEIHQLFVPGRGGQVTDVIIDSVGSVVGIGLYVGIKTVNLCGLKNTPEL